MKLLYNIRCKYYMLHNYISDIKKYSIYWYKTGRNYNYPICCILFFIFTPICINKKYNNPMKYTGYLMCPICRKKYYNKR